MFLPIKNSGSNAFHQLLFIMKTHERWHTFVNDCCVLIVCFGNVSGSKFRGFLGLLFAECTGSYFVS
jgi:hypothetical protein